MHLTRRFMLGAIVVFAVAALAGCGGPGEPDTDGQGRYVIHMTADSKFSPDKARIPVNSTVVWVNGANIPHDVQGYGEGQPFSSGDFGALNQRGSSYEFTFTKPGTYEYYCYVHHGSGMVGILEVR